MAAVREVLSSIAEWVDLIGLSIVLIGALKFLVSYVQLEVRRLTGRRCARELQTERLALGAYILVALEFLIVSDLIASVVSRSLEGLGYLAAIVALRTTMGFFLGRELSEAREVVASEQDDVAGDTAAPD